MEKELPVRKHPRLKNYDYSSNGAYFITMCVEGRHEMLGQIVGRDAPGAPFVELTEYGKIIRKEIGDTHLHYKNVIIDKFIVMPNHIHMIILIQNENKINENGAPRASRPTSALIPNVIGILKRKTNKKYGFQMWQDSYHDHIIRDREDYRIKWQYIDTNPAKWAEDDYFINESN
ncbi:MAG: hypothetical protein FWF92_02695 [Oscillospiraceae bacterium]|nr:hypothetical protein [Oscillospiraceae bacterium]